MGGVVALCVGMCVLVVGDVGLGCITGGVVGLCAETRVLVVDDVGLGWVALWEV